jgi:hypothetical protein
MNIKVLLLLGLSFLSIADLQQGTQPVLIKRYEKGYSLHSLEDNAAYVVDSAGRGGRVVVRVCSKERLPFALSMAAADPFVISTILTVDYHLTPERILYVRSEDCLGPEPDVAATELWAIPDGASLPPSVESIRSSQVRSETIGTAATAEGTANYRAAVAELIKKLRVKPEAVGIVLGYYYRRPNTSMQRRLRDVRDLLEQSGLSQDRYRIRLMPWNSERSIDPPEPEPKYPSLFIIVVRRDSTGVRR